MARTKRKSHTSFQAAAYNNLYTLPGGGSASSRLDQWYVSSLHADWIRDIDMSASGLAADHNGITIRIVTPRTVMQVCKPMRVYPVPGCAHKPANGKKLLPLRSHSDMSTILPCSDVRLSHTLKIEHLVA